MRETCGILNRLWTGLQTAFRPVLSVRGANTVPTRRPNDVRTVLYAGSSRGSMRIFCFSFVVYAERNVAIRIVFIRLFRIFVSNLTITRTLWQNQRNNRCRQGALQGVRGLCVRLPVRRARAVGGGQQQRLSRCADGQSRCLHGLCLLRGDLSG